MKPDQRDSLLSLIDLLDGPIDPAGPAPEPEAFLRALREAPFWTLSPDAFGSSSVSSTYRNAPGSGGLELSKTRIGVQAWDPDATHLTLLAVNPAGRAWRVGQAEAAQPGVSAAAQLGEGAQLDVVAIATSGPIDVPLACQWLERVRVADQRPTGTDCVHVAWLSVRRDPSTALLRIRPEALPATSPQVQKWLSAAATRGRADDYSGAAVAYAQALSLAQDDAQGRIKARLGFAQFLYSLGFLDDAHGVLVEVAETESLDASLGCLLAVKLAWHAVHAWDLSDARRWADEALRLDPDARGARLLHSQLLLFEDRWDDALQAQATLPASIHESPLFTPMLEAQAALCLAETGRLSAAVTALPHRDALGTLPLEVQLWSVLGWAVVQHGRGGDPWGRAVELAGTAMRGHAGALVPIRDDQILVVLAARAFEAGHHQAVTALLRLRLGLEESAQALCVAMSPVGLLVSTPDQRVQAHPLGVAELELLRAGIRQEWSGGQAGNASAAVRALLQVNPAHPAAWIACDGSLAGMPVEHLVAPGRPVLRVHSSALPERARTERSVVSFADAMGDLPGAREEVTAQLADQRYVRHAATWSALQGLGPVGLLHLGVHAGRVNGVSVLHFADGPVSAAEIASLSLRGGPVVILGGCGTAPKAGTERALGQAFREAGASAVIATHWPMRDGELVDFVRRLLDRWPFEDAARAVASVVQELREEGRPKRLWGAPTVM